MCIGYEIQRRILERKYRDETTAGQLWTRGELAEADYAVGTVVTDHFEVVDRAPERILLRCGGSPKVSDVRESDGLFEIGARVKEEEGVAEFYLKSVLFQGLGKAEAGSKGPMPEWMVALHKVYAKIWMETAIWACMK